MGGYGSGRWQWHEKKFTVERCVSVDIAELKADIRALSHGECYGVELSTPLSGFGQGEIKLVLRRGRHGDLFVDLYIHAENAAETSELQSTHPNYGGLRWWFTCPFPCCAHRVRKLYYLPGSMSFGCWRCLGLTYRSCQESHRYDSFYAHIAARVGTTVQAVRRVFR